MNNNWPFTQLTKTDIHEVIKGAKEIASTADIDPALDPLIHYQESAQRYHRLALRQTLGCLSEEAIHELLCLMYIGRSCLDHTRGPESIADFMATILASGKDVEVQQIMSKCPRLVQYLTLGLENLESEV